MSKPDLLVDFCDYKAAKYAVEHWHYSKSKPIGKTVEFGAWENGAFVGTVIFSPGISNNLGKPYGLNPFEMTELVRVALKSHKTNVSKIIALAIKLLRKQSPGLRLIASFADVNEAHLGIIYQAGNWIYTGTTPKSKAYRAPNNKIYHSRMINTKGYKKDFGRMRKTWKPNECQTITLLGKHRYLYPLDRAMRRKIAHLSQPYPKKIAPPVNGDTIATSDAGRFNPDPEAS